MDIRIKNIGMLSEANIRMDGLTVITGENNSGKSTVGKLLYSVYSALNNLDDVIEDKRIESIKEDVDTIFRIIRELSPDQDLRQLQLSFYLTLHGSKNWYPNLGDRRQALLEAILSIENKIYIQVDIKQQTKKYFDRIKDKIYLEESSLIVKKTAIQKSLNAEFNKQINNLFKDELAMVSINEGNTPVVSFKIINNILEENQFVGEEITYSDITYIESPLIIDYLIANTSNSFDDRTGIYNSHSKDLLKKISNKNYDENIVSDIFLERELEYINKQISKVIKGNVIEDGNDYKYETNGKKINLENLATGLKSYLIIKMLLDKRILNSNAILIIDEPEVHLHPEWQIVYAELIVLLAKEIGSNILLTSHSPYFIEAIEVFSKKHKFAEKTRFYLAEKLDEKSSTIQEITGELEKTYKKLLKPFQELENIKAECGGYGN